MVRNASSSSADVHPHGDEDDAYEDYDDEQGYEPGILAFAVVVVDGGVGGVGVGGGGVGAGAGAAKGEGEGGHFWYFGG